LLTISLPSLSTFLPFKLSLWRLALASATDVQFPPRGACNWLELDPTEQRYLLAASGDGSVSAFDVGGGGGSGEAATPAAPVVAVPPLFVIGGRAPAAASSSSSSSSLPTAVAHRFAATCVTWYPVDSGAFVSGGADGEVKVWDANAEAAVAAFSLSGGVASTSSSASVSADPSGLPRVMVVAMSPASASHALIAVGAAAGGGAGAISAAPGAGAGGASALRLADARAGALTHALGAGPASTRSPSSSMSAAAVWCAAWSLTDANQLLSGSADGTARAWDVRRADACVATLDLDDTRDARREERQRRRQRREAAEAEERGTTTTAELPIPPPPPPRTSAAYRRAHDAAVTGLLPTPDGLGWVTAGADSAVRLWSARAGEGFQREPHALPDTFNRARRPRQLAAAASPAALFHPSGSAVQVLPLPGGERSGYFGVGGGGGGDGGGGGGGARHRGNLAAPPPALGRRGGVLLRGHVDAVHACAWSEQRRELYTGGDDKCVLVWSSAAAAAAAGAAADGEEEQEGGEETERRVRRRRGGGDEDEDAWSD